jgi:hypothetical protein
MSNRLNTNSGWVKLSESCKQKSSNRASRNLRMAAEVRIGVRSQTGSQWIPKHRNPRWVSLENQKLRNNVSLPDSILSAVTAEPDARMEHKPVLQSAKPGRDKKPILRMLLRDGYARDSHEAAGTIHCAYLAYRGWWSARNDDDETCGDGDDGNSCAASSVGLDPSSGAFWISHSTARAAANSNTRPTGHTSSRLNYQSRNFWRVG